MLYMSSAQCSGTEVLKPAVKKEMCALVNKMDAVNPGEKIYSLAILYECVHRSRYKI